MRVNEFNRDWVQVMRVSREQAEKNRQAVLETAAQLFRQRGVDGVGVADLMKAAGLTHGGFYGQFKSKEDLVTQATTQALRENEDNRQRALKSTDNPWEAIKQSYLSPLHRRHPEAGCAFTTLAVEGSRRGEPLQSVLTSGLEHFLKDLEPIVPRKRGKTRREQSITALSAMVGAMVLARAVDDDALATEILDTVKDGL